MGLAADGPDPFSPWTPPRLREACGRLPRELRDRWVWWRLPVPEARRPLLAALLELKDPPRDAPWHSPEETQRLLQLMPPLHQRRVREAQRFGRPVVGTMYRRMRDGAQRAEIRMDGLAGCLRASRGGSSRLILVIIEGESIRSRRLSVREAARLMGIPDGFRLPLRADAYGAVGDGVAVPVVRWLSEQLLLPLARIAEENPAGAPS